MAPGVKVRLEVEGTPEAIAAIRAFTAQTKAAGAEAAVSFATLGSAFSGVVGGAGKLLGVVGITAGISQMVRFTTETIAAAAEVKDLARSLGTTTERMSALVAIAKLTGTDTRALAGGLAALADRIDQLRAGVPAVTSAFARLRTAQGRPLTARDFASEDILVNADLVSSALGRVENGLTRGAIAADLMGKNGRALIPVFEKLIEQGGLAKAIDFAKATGLSVDAQTVATIDRLNEQMQKLKLYAAGAALQVSIGLGPTASLALDSLTKRAYGAADAFLYLGRVAGAFARIVFALGHTIAVVADDVLFGILLGFEGIFTVLGDLFRRDFKRAEYDAKLAFDRIVFVGKRALKDLGTSWADVLREPAAGTSVLGSAGGEAPPQPDPSISSALLAARERFFNAEQAMYEAIRAREEAIDKRAYERGTLSLEDYFARRRKRIEEDAAYRIRRLEREVAEAARIQNEDQRRATVGALNNQISTISQERDRKLFELGIEMEDARKKANQLAADIRSGLIGALEDFFSTGINDAKSLLSLFTQLGLSIAMMIQKMAALRIATAIVDSIPFLGGAKKAAAGGLIFGPGTGTSDSIPAWLSSGEYVMPAHRVNAPGMLAALRSMHYGGDLSVAMRGLRTPSLRPLRGFADGGLVQSSALGAPGSVGGQINIGLDDGLVLRAIESPAGQRVLLKVVSRNPRAFGSALRRS